MYHTKLGWAIRIFSLLLFLALITYLIWNAIFDNSLSEEDCIDLSSLSSFYFDACFDLPTNTIFLDVKRASFSSYDVESFNVNFFDGSNRSYELTNIPQAGKDKTFTMSSSKNPYTMSLFFKLSSNTQENICNKPRKISLNDCLRANQFKLNNSRFFNNESDYKLNFSEKESFWKSICASKWECSPWSYCDEGIQRRHCIDLNKCTVSVEIPQRTRYCEDYCVEDWRCEWSACSENMTSPTCVDMNECGTNFNKPDNIFCFSDLSCIPDIECTEWTNCSVNYDLSDYEEGKNIRDTGGYRSRTCSDKNSCTGSVREIQSCLTNADVHTERIEKCGVEYLGIYNTLSNQLIASVRDTDSDFIISFGDYGEYCEHCFNGILDEDEIGIDCDGSCVSCEKKYRVIKSDDGWFSWLKKLFS